MSAETEVGSWHAISSAEAFRRLDSRPAGLTSTEATERLERFGPNRLPQQPPSGWWRILLRQFQSPLIYVLVAAAVVALATGDAKDAAFIGLVLALNAVIGGWQEWKAEQSSRALQQLLHSRATVERDGDAREVDAEDVVPGDVVWLESGNRVPADLRLVSDHGLEIDESLLTGESLAVRKESGWLGTGPIPLGDRRNLAFAASIVVRGRGKGLVVGTGAGTEVGRLAADVLTQTGGKPPLLERMEGFARTLAIVVMVSVAAVAALGMLVLDYSAKEMFLFGVALAVSAIPEGLPAALTVALAVATTRMARRGVIVRRLAAVEGLGSCTLIASDKTGTLTCNELTVRVLRLPDGSELSVRGEGFAPDGDIERDGVPTVAAADEALRSAVLVGVLCNEADLHHRDGLWAWRGDPTDVALLSLGRKAGLARERLLDEHPQVNEIPFEPEHRFSASFHQVDGHVRVFVKGAPERVLAMCDASVGPGGNTTLRDAAEELARQGCRVLALADGPAQDDLGPDAVPPQPSGLAFRGFVGMIDPLRPGVRESVDRCRGAGIAVCMVTGDHPATALAIARDLGLADRPEQVVSGAELGEGDAERYRLAIAGCRVFARVSPRQKLELVQAARAAGHFVAVTGDGVNDAPALRAANIGVAMGRSGTDVAREAAELVVSDDDFSSIVAGVEEGRIAYDNVRKVVYLLVSAGAAEVLLIGATFAVGSLLPLPFLPVQLLWLNLVTNGIQGVAMAFEPGEQGILRRRPRRPDEPVFDRLMIERTLIAAVVMAVVGCGAFWWMIRSGWSEDSARNVLLLMMVLFENVHVANCRSETLSAFHDSPFRSPYLFGGAFLALLVHVVGMHVPFLRDVLRTAPVSAATWGWTILGSLTALAALEVHKFVRRRRPLP